MTPLDFLTLIVRPNVETLNTNYDDIRHAFNAVASVDALAACLFHWCKDNAPVAIVGLRDDSHFREKLSRSCEEFSLLRDLAKTQKHFRLDRGNPLIFSATQVSTRSLGWGQAKWGSGRWGSPSQVVVETNAGELRPVEDIVRKALEFIESEMKRLGALR